MVRPFDRRGSLILESLATHSIDEIVAAFDGVLTRAQITAFLDERRREGLLDDGLRLEADLVPDRSLPDLLSAPLRVYYSVTGACNLRCLHCVSGPRPASIRESELTLDDIMRLFDEMAMLGVFEVNVGGGEPFARPDIADLLREGSLKGLAMSVTTNGLLLTREKARLLAEIPLRCLAVSLDGASRATHEAIRGKGTFDGALEAIRIAKEETGHRVILQFTMMKHNLHELEAIFELAEQSAADALGVAVLRPAGTALSHPNLWVSGEEFALSVRRLHDLSRDFPMQVHLPITLAPDYPRRLYRGFGCGAARLNCHLDAMGRYSPCNYFEESGVAGSLQSVWLEGPAFRRLRELEGNDECLRCPHYDNCRGFCRASALAQAGDLNAPDTLCVHLLA
jgi:radical SAM protein with 4Fe4S-binding SPASM domain